MQDDLINKFNLKRVYWDSRIEDARIDLGKHTDVFSDRKSGIITIQVTDTSPERAAAMGREYISELNQVVIQLNTSSAHRERVFLGDRLTQVKQDLESAEQRFSEFASKNTALDIPEQGKAMIQAAATMEGQLIAAQTELESLKQIYADGNVRVRSTQARVDELHRQLEKSLGEKSGDPSPSKAQDADSLYPTIRQLPVLGVSYAESLPEYQSPGGNLSDSDATIRTREGRGSQGDAERQGSGYSGYSGEEIFSSTPADHVPGNDAGHGGRSRVGCWKKPLG